MNPVRTTKQVFKVINTNGNAPRLSDMVQALQPPDAKLNRISYRLLALCGALIIVPLLLFAHFLVPTALDVLPSLLTGYPLNVQILAILVVVIAVSVPIFLGLRKLFKRTVELRADEVALSDVRESPGGTVVYVSGSGADGYVNHVRRFSRQAHITPLSVFAHTAHEDRGGVSINGPNVFTAPVKHAEGRIESAESSRVGEADGYRDAHEQFLRMINAQDTRVEWSVLHVGGGHTSISCHTEWEEERTTRLANSTGCRFALIIRDATGRIDVDEPDLPMEVDASMHWEDELLELSDTEGYVQDQNDCDPSDEIENSEEVMPYGFYRN